MKKILSALFSTSILLAGVTALAHEGHDHAPGQVRSQFGGVVKSGKGLDLEFVTEGNKVSVYPLAHENDSLNFSDLKLSASSKAPKGKAVPLKLEKKDKAYEGEIDFKSASRVELEVDAIYKGKKESFTYQVEKP